ncbi:MAG: asparaginase [Frankiales bacterium]|jgi:L-asparaginase|nr:asparaginase [Frankiales bacterium]
MTTDVRPRIALVIAGGTIDSLGATRLDLAGYPEAASRLSPGRLLSDVPELSEICDVREIPFRRLSSYALTPQDWLELAGIIDAVLLDEAYDGVVITHGTNTLEETAYFLDLTTRSPKPIVLVGAMRPASALGADGYLNLFRAVQVASSPAARDLGVLVVMNDAIYAARDVTKTATFRINAFQAPDLGPLGYADADGEVVIYHRRPRAAGSASFCLAGLDNLPRVDVVMSYVGADGTFIDAATAAGTRGIVSAGTGAGRVTPLEEEAFMRASAAGVVLCQSSRVGSGRVPAPPPAKRATWVAADNLRPWKARILLSLALTQTSDVAEVGALFALHVPSEGA